MTLRLSAAVEECLRCPVCRSRLEHGEGELACVDSGCHRRFPVVDDIPILIDESRSIFSVAEFVSRHNTTFVKTGRLEAAVSKMTPSISCNVTSGRNYDRLGALLTSRHARPRVLVVGGSVLGQGMKKLLAGRSLELVETDVTFGARTALICDAHTLPFADESFDGVIAQAVLEHVVDPYRCVDEMFRVLKTGGLVYAETPFIQQVHMGRFDFTRFTHLGHRRLFRRFDAIDTGAANGPGMALAWSYQYFLLSFVTSRMARGLVRAFAGATSFYLKYFDYLLIGKPGALDAASAVYFLGSKAAQPLDDRDLIRQYRGGSLSAAP